MLTVVGGGVLIFEDRGSLDFGYNVLDLMFYLYSNIQTHKGIYYISETEVVAADCWVVGVLTDATLIPVVDIDDVILTEPLFTLLSNEDVLFVLAQNLCFVCTVCHCGFAFFSSCSSFSKCD